MIVSVKGLNAEEDRRGILVTNLKIKRKGLIEINKVSGAVQRERERMATAIMPNRTVAERGGLVTPAARIIVGL